MQGLQVENAANFRPAKWPSQKGVGHKRELPLPQLSREEEEVALQQFTSSGGINTSSQLKECLSQAGVIASPDEVDAEADKVGWSEGDWLQEGQLREILQRIKRRFLDQQRDSAGDITDAFVAVGASDGKVSSESLLIAAKQCGLRIDLDQLQKATDMNDQIISVSHEVSPRGEGEEEISFEKFRNLFNNNPNKRRGQRRSLAPLKMGQGRPGEDLPVLVSEVADLMSPDTMTPMDVGPIGKSEAEVTANYLQKRLEMLDTASQQFSQNIPHHQNHQSSLEYGSDGQKAPHHPEVRHSAAGFASYEKPAYKRELPSLKIPGGTMPKAVRRGILQDHGLRVSSPADFMQRSRERGKGAGSSGDRFAQPLYQGLQRLEESGLPVDPHAQPNPALAAAMGQREIGAGTFTHPGAGKKQLPAVRVTRRKGPDKIRNHVLPAQGHAQMIVTQGFR